MWAEYCMGPRGDELELHVDTTYLDIYKKFDQTIRRLEIGKLFVWCSESIGVFVKGREKPPTDK